MCDSLESGVGAVFGPTGPEASAAVRSICASMQVPHVETHWRASAGGRAGYDYYANVYPDPAELSRGYTAIVRDMDWTSFTLLYQSDEALLRLQHLVRDYSGSARPSDADQSAVAIVKLPENRDFRYGRVRGPYARFVVGQENVRGGSASRTFIPVQIFR